jgi:PAS domain S-box-containing protein
MPSDKTIKVLLIDDDEAALILTTAILGQIPEESFELEWVGTSADGRRAMAESAHDVYLVDYKLGEDNGIDLVREARSLQNRAPMILLTGKGRYEVDVEAMEAGVSDYLEKAKVNPDTMERSIRYARERVRAEAALRESEERHRSMFDHLPNGLYRTTVDGELLDANPALVTMLGRPDRDTLQFEYARNFFVSPSHRQSFLHRLQGGVVRGFESELKRTNGTTLHVRNAARAHRTPDGTIQYIEGAVEDVSEERHAKDLHRRAARFSWVFEGSGLAILLLELTGGIRDANPAFLRAFDHSLTDLVGRPLTDLAYDGDKSALTDEISRIASGADVVGEAQRRLMAADGEVLWARTRIGLVRTWDGHPDHVIVLFEDVAEA